MKRQLLSLHLGGVGKIAWTALTLLIVDFHVGLFAVKLVPFYHTIHSPTMKLNHLHFELFGSFFMSNTNYRDSYSTLCVHV